MRSNVDVQHNKNKQTNKQKPLRFKKLLEFSSSFSSQLRTLLTMHHVIFVLLLAICCHSLEQRFFLEYSVDEGSTWHRKATLTSTTDSEAQPDIKVSAMAAEKWNIEHLSLLRNPNQPYLIRIIDDTKSTVSQLALSPCALIMSKQYAGTLNYISERYAVSLLPNGKISGFKYATAFSDTVCDVSSAFKLPPEATVKQKVVVHSLHGLQSPEFKVPLPTGVSPKASDKGAKKEKEEEKQEDNRSFFQKYWWYIVIFLGMQVVSSLFMKPPQQQGQGQQASK